MRACANQQIPLTYRGEGSLKTTEDLFEASQVSKLNYLDICFVWCNAPSYVWSYVLNVLYNLRVFQDKYTCSFSIVCYTSQIKSEFGSVFFKEKSLKCHLNCKKKNYYWILCPGIFVFLRICFHLATFTLWTETAAKLSWNKFRGWGLVNDPKWKTFSDTKLTENLHVWYINPLGKLLIERRFILNLWS